MADIPKSGNTGVNQPESKNIIKEGQHLKISDEFAGELATAVSQLENKIPEPIDMDVHEYIATKKYLQHAPEEFKKLWATSSARDKEDYRKHVEFTVDGPNIIGASGKKYELAKDNLTVEDKDLKKGAIDMYEGCTYFNPNILDQYIAKHSIKLPNKRDYLDMMKVMPKWKEDNEIAGLQLFLVLGVKLVGSLSDGVINQDIDYGYGYLYSSSKTRDNERFALTVNENSGGGLCEFKNLQCPVLVFRSSE